MRLWIIRIRRRHTTNSVGPACCAQSLRSLRVLSQAEEKTLRLRPIKHFLTESGDDYSGSDSGLRGTQGPVAALVIGVVALSDRRRETG